MWNGPVANPLHAVVSHNRLGYDESNRKVLRYCSRFGDPLRQLPCLDQDSFRGIICLNSKADFIGANACTGDSACNTIGEQASICNSACQGAFACNQLFRESNVGSVVGRNSCDGEVACNSFASLNTDGPHTIGENSCIGEGACLLVAAHNPGTPRMTTIGNNACIGAYNCNRFGESAETSVEVADGLCNADSSICNGIDMMTCHGVGCRSSEDEVFSIATADDTCDSACKLQS